VEPTLIGIQAKYDRAKEQFDLLRDEMHEFFNKGQPYSFSEEFDSDTWEWVKRVNVNREPPVRFGVVLGDVIHNLRSALDHLMWQVTLLDGGTPNELTQFPVATKDEAQFNGMAGKHIPDLSPEHRAIVQGALPPRESVCESCPRCPQRTLPD
jgi:hypothetical protein